MNIRKLVVRSVTAFAVTLIVSVIVTLLWNLIVHGATSIDWETSFRSAILFSIILPWIATRRSKAHLQHRPDASVFVPIVYNVSARRVAPGFHIARPLTSRYGSCCTRGGRATPTAWNVRLHVPVGSVRRRNRLPACSTSTYSRPSRSRTTSAHSN